MSSAFSSALTKLDGSVQTVQYQLDCLKAALEVNDDQLNTSLMDARQHAAILRDLIRAERPDAHWIDRRALEQLINEIEIAAKARRNQQRRTKLLDLANELDAGRVKHRFGPRTTALNTVRLEAIKELRTEAAHSEQTKDLPGPNASEWLHWACGLQDEKDALVLINLRRDFASVERFAGEMEETYWIPGQRVQESPVEHSEPAVQTWARPAAQPAIQSVVQPAVQSSVQPVDEPVAESLPSPSSQSVAPVSRDADKLPQNVRTQFDKAIQSGNYAEALSLCTERPSSEAPSVPETLWHPEAATHWPPPTAAAAGEPSDVQTTHDSYVVLDKIAEAGAGVAAGSEAHVSPLLQMGRVLSSEAAVPQPAEWPSADLSRKPAEMGLEELEATLRRRYSEADEPGRLFTGSVPAKKHLGAWVVVASILVLGVIFAVIYYFNATTTSSNKPGATVATTGVKTEGGVQDSDIQKDIEQRLAVLKGSSIQVTVQDGVVTLAGRSASKEDLVKAETLASQANGVKVVRNEIQVEAHNPNPASSTAKGPEQNVSSRLAATGQSTVISTEAPQEIDKAAVQRLILAGNRATQNGEYDSAIFNYRKALHADPQNTDARAGLRSAQQAKLSKTE